MNEQLQNAIQALKEKFGCEEHTYRGEHTLFVAAEQIVDACQVLRDEFGFNLLSSLTATDYWPEETPRMHVSYQLYSIGNNITLRLYLMNGEDFYAEKRVFLTFNLPTATPEPTLTPTETLPPPTDVPTNTPIPTIPTNTPPPTITSTPQPPTATPIPTTP